MANLDKKPEQALVWGLKEKFPWPITLLENLDASPIFKYRGKGIPHYVMIDKKGFVQATGLPEIFAKVNELPAELIIEEVVEKTEEEMMEKEKMMKEEEMMKKEA